MKDEKNVAENKRWSVARNVETVPKATAPHLDSTRFLKRPQDGHVSVTLFQTEFVDTKIANLAQVDGAVFRGQPGFMDLLDQIPTHAEILGHCPEGAELQQFENGQGKRPCVAGVSFDKRQARPPEATASCALQPMHDHLQQSLFTADRGAIRNHRTACPLNWQYRCPQV